jgi:hypothetical protein
LFQPPINPLFRRRVVPRLENGDCEISGNFDYIARIAELSIWQRHQVDVAVTAQ